MASSVLYTGKTGPAQAVTTLTMSNVRDIDFNIQEEVLYVTLENGQVRQFDLAATTTLTGTASAGNFTFSVTQ